nr:phosphate ABC transporter substrate-binding protein PstS [Austwickia chelonae]
MKMQGWAFVSTISLIGVAALASCGSNDNSAVTGGGSAGSSVKIADCQQGNLKGEGSSAQKNAIDMAISSYGGACPGAQVDYNPSGSGAGIKNFNAGQVDFGGTDSVLKPAESAAAEKRCSSTAWHVPMVAGPIAVSYNVKGVDSLVLTPELMAKIFQGEITAWNDPAIAEVNKGASLPNTPIRVFFRSDESGTTENFTKYLKAAAGTAWRGEAAKTWTGKGEGKEKSSGVAKAVKDSDGGITYVELSYAKDNGLKLAQVDNGAGPVALTSDNVGKAIAAATQEGEGNDLRLKVDFGAKTPGAYPIVLVTYEVVCSDYEKNAQAAYVRSFLKHFASDSVQKSLEGRGYAPLPTEVLTKVRTTVDAIQ